MNIQDKTKEQLIADLQLLEEENRKLKNQQNDINVCELIRETGKNIDLIDFEYFELVFNTSPDIAIISRLSDSMVIKVNDGFTKNTGYTREEALNAPRFNVNLWQNPDERKLLLNEIQKYGAFENIETTMVRKNGTKFRSLVSARLFQFQGEQYVSSISRDITYINNLEQKLLESNVNARTIMEASNDVIILLDKNGLIIDTNEIHAKRFTLTRNDLIGKDIFKLLPNDLAQNRYYYFKQVLETGKPSNYEDFRAGYWNEVSCYPVFDESKKIDKVVIYAKDITEKKLAEIALKESEEKFKKSQKELSRFSIYLLKVRENERAEITLEIHDSIAQFLVALKVEMGLFLKKISSGIDVVKAYEVIAKMEQLVSQVDITLKSARMIMNGLRPEQLDLLGLVAATEVYLHNFEEIHHIKSTFENSVSETKIQKEQSIILFRILQESLTNILKHAKANFVSVKLTEIEGYLIMEITDNGVGFDEKCMLQPDSYGVISMREQVKRLDGIFKISSKLGQGTVVRVEIPYKELKISNSLYGK